jgi:predicted phage tail protein
MMATVPRAPQNFVGAANGRQVTLLWTDPGNTTHFDIEVGSAAGLSNIMTRSVSGTTFTVNGVPSGRYYVRLRAINNIGRSVPTADVEIIVP